MTVASQEASINDFGLLIAYVLPGFTALWGLGYLVPEVHAWLGHPPSEAPTLGGFLYVTLASVGIGLAVSTVRWLVIDGLHHRTGVPRPEFDFARLQQNVQAFGVLLDIHYKYYQFYGNSLVALIWVQLARRASQGFFEAPVTWVDVGFLLLEVVFFVGSRDTLRKYYVRTGHFLEGADLTRGAGRR